MLPKYKITKKDLISEMVVKIKEYFEKTRQIKNTYNCKYICTLIIVSIFILKITTNLKSTFYVEKEM